MEIKTFGDLIDLDDRKLEVYPPPTKRQPERTWPSKTVEKKRDDTPVGRIIASIVERVTQSNIEMWVKSMSTFHTRHTLSTQLEQIATYLHDEFSNIGYLDTGFHQYIKNGSIYKNVVCTKNGIVNNNRVLIVCGHYDSCAKPFSDANVKAPGADDNATGIASILEIARILYDVELKDEIQFVAFSGEEQGLWGSTAYAQHLQDTDTNLIRLINLDMVGYSPPDGHVIVEYDMGNKQSVNDEESRQYGQLMAQMAVHHTSLSTVHANIENSDYMPFEERGYVVIGAYEGGHNPYYHTSKDTPENIDYKYVADITKMVLSTLLTETLVEIE